MLPSSRAEVATTWSLSLLERLVLLVLFAPLLVVFAIGGALAGLTVAVGSFLEEWRHAWRVSA